MGTHGRRGFAHMILGSDAERVVHESRLPVLLVRHPEAPKR
jgi:nucleotide-binding universal stress UspA family protein